MSTPLLIDSTTGEIVLNMTSGPAAGVYKSDSLDGEDGVITKFKAQLETVTGNAAKTAATNQFKIIQQKYLNNKNLQAKLAGNLTTAKMRGNTSEIERISGELATARAAKRSAKGAEWAAVDKQKKIACGWTPGWLPGSLVAPKNPAPGCTSTNFVGGTRRRKATRRSHTRKSRN